MNCLKEETLVMPLKTNMMLESQLRSALGIKADGDLLLPGEQFVEEIICYYYYHYYS